MFVHGHQLQESGFTLIAENVLAAAMFLIDNLLVYLVTVKQKYQNKYLAWNAKQTYFELQYTFIKLAIDIVFIDKLFCHGNTSLNCMNVVSNHSPASKLHTVTIISNPRFEGYLRLL